MRRAFPILGAPLSAALIALSLPVLAPVLVAAPASAQSLFAPVMQINDRVITRYELEQRAAFYSLLSAPGDPLETAKERLIEEKLQLFAAEEMGLTVTPEEIIAGEEEFAGRANLDRATFLEALSAGGVEEQTFRDFVTTGLLWRELVRQRFGPRVQVSDADIDNELRTERPSAENIRLLYSEIILPANTPAAKETAQRRAAEITDMTSIEAFSQAARAFSAAPSAGRGGRVDWVDVTALAPGLAQQLLSLSPGQVTDPLPIPNGIALLQLRDVQDGTPPPPQAADVDYAVYLIPGGATPANLAEAARVQARAPTCGELLELNRTAGRPASALDYVETTLDKVPGDIALELAKLDPSEYAVTTRGGNLALIMLCSRTVPLPEPAAPGTADAAAAPTPPQTPDEQDEAARNQIRQQLQNRQVAAYADAYLAELRDSAVILVP